MKKMLMIVNPLAGKNKSRGPLYDAAAELSEAGYALSIHNTAGPGDAYSYVLRYGNQFDAVTAAGGDGTLNETASGLLELQNPPPLLYLPQGSTNDFAASLHIPLNPPEAASIIRANSIKYLDAGQWNHRHFIYIASFGAFTRSSYAAPQASKNALGHFAYILEGMRDLESLRPYQIHLTADGECLDGEYLFGAICNSTSVGGILKLEKARVILDDGLFELLLIPNPKNPLDLQNIMMSLVNQEYENLIFRHVSSVSLETRENLPWSLDGEYAPSAARVEIQNRRQALAMFLP